jgi:tocopherol cyclase-like protein
MNNTEFIKKLLIKTTALALFAFLVPLNAEAQESKALKELQNFSQQENKAFNNNIENFNFVLPTALQETSILNKLQDLPWQENGIITKTLDGENKLFGLGEKLKPRFEGWYTRITDKDGERSFAFIVGSFLPAGASFSESKPMPGYIAVLISDGEGKTLKVYETFPKNTVLSVNGETALNQNPLENCSADSNLCQSNFHWSAEGYGSVNNSSFSLKIPGEINIKGNFSEPIYWDGERNGSPEGMATNISILPIHWYVHSLGSQSKYEYNIPSENISVKSSGYAHIEKNWGNAFPSKWIWSEGITDDNASHYALGGGEINMGAFKMTAFLVGIHTSKISWDFKPQQGTVFKTQINSCSGNFSIALARPGRKLIIESKADINTFAKVSIPTPTGFVSGGGVESFSATTTIEAYKVNILGIHTLVEKKTFKNAALEFGSNYMCGGFGL